MKTRQRKKRQKEHTKKETNRNSQHTYTADHNTSVGILPGRVKRQKRSEVQTYRSCFLNSSFGCWTVTIINAFCWDKQPWHWVNRYRSFSNPRVPAIWINIRVLQQPPFCRVPVKVGVVTTVVGISQAGIGVKWVNWGSRVKWLSE